MNLTQIEQALAYGDEINNGKQALFSEGRNLDKIREIRHNPFYSRDMQNILEDGEGYLTEPIETLRFSDYKIFDTKGSRKEYEKGYFKRRTRLNTLAILSLVMGDKKYISALEDSIWAICDEYTWCLPAHLGGKSLEPDFRHEAVIDLFASETGFALAEICRLLEGSLSTVVKDRAGKLTYMRVIEPYIKSGGSFWWETTNNNWASVCSGSVGAACLYLIDDISLLASVVFRVIETMKCFIDGYDADGACKEGLGYWNYGFGFFTYFAELLRQRTAGKIDLMLCEKIYEIALFQQRCCLGGDSTISFADGDMELELNPGLTVFLKNRFPEIEIPSCSSCLTSLPQLRKRWAHLSRGLFWNSPEMKCDLPADAVHFLRDSQLLISRKVLSDGQVSFAAKGGHNGEQHNHNDIGSFILNINGESILTDTGKGEYTKQYFGPSRYSVFCNGSQGHSVPVVNGIYQSAGSEHCALVLKQVSGPLSDILVLDITRAYDDESLISLERSFEFIKDSPQRLVLKDTYSFKEKPSSVVERFVTFIRPELAGKGKIRLQGRKGSITVEYDPQMLDLSIKEDTFINHQAEAIKVYCLDLCAVNPAISFTSEVSFICRN